MPYRLRCGGKRNMMIPVKELRIGNLIFDNDGAIAKVIGLKPYDHSVRCDEEEGCDLLIDIHGADGKIRIGWAVESTDANPIPLTPEWLERCGFEKRDAEEITFDLEKGTDWYWVNGRLIWWHGLQNKDTGERYEHIKHVHDLQNFSRLFTGEELNVKL